MSEQTSLNDKEVIPLGKIKCFISGRLRKDTPEEKVRQEIARSLVEEYGYDKTDIEIEFPIKVGRARKRVDIAVFYEGKKHLQKNIYIIAEAKTEDAKPSHKDEGVGQLESYLAASLNVAFGLWVGSERISYKIVEKEGERILVSVSDIPPRGETAVPRPTRGSLKPAANLKLVFKRIHNYIYVNQGLPKEKAFEELLKLIFIKVYDEEFSPRLQFYISPDDEIPQIRERCSNLFEKVKKRYGYIFTPIETIELNNRTLSYCVAELQRFSLVGTDVDVKGEGYEEIVGPNLRGDRGEFFTPRDVCKMTIEMIFALFSEEKLTSPSGIRILDPAVGTGGFLIVAIQKIREYLAQRGYKHDKLRELVRQVAESNLFGIDFNPFLVKVAQMNNVMHGNGSLNIVHANSLEHPSNWSGDVIARIIGEEAKVKGIEGFRKYSKKQEEPEEIDKLISKFDIVVTNPPFGTKAVINDPDILRQYELAVESPKSSLPPEQLFIERCLQFLKPGGIMGIVLPDSILGNPGLNWIRIWILGKAYIIASIDFPTVTFEPSVGTSTSVLFLRKTAAEEIPQEEEYEIFMAIPKKVGHDRRGNPIFKTSPDGKIRVDEQGNPILDDDLPLIQGVFKKWLRTKGLV